MPPTKASAIAYPFHVEITGIDLHENQSQLLPCCIRNIDRLVSVHSSVVPLCREAKTRGARRVDRRRVPLSRAGSQTTLQAKPTGAIINYPNAPKNGMGLANLQRTTKGSCFSDKV